jgi:hypothetical protein
VPGRLPGRGENPLLRLAFQVQYAGAADFQGHPPNMGFVNLKLKVISPLLPRTCFIGTDEDPMVIKPLAFESPKPVDGHPELRFTALQDERFVLPRARLRPVHQRCRTTVRGAHADRRQ